MNKDLKKFIKCALIRAIKTMAQSAVALIPVATSITQVDWFVVLGTSLMTGILSILTSVATGLPEAKEG